MLTIPIIATPSQVMTVTLGGQPCSIGIHQKDTGLYFDLKVSGVQIVQSMVCLDRVNLVRHEYLPFVGNLAFIDTRGTNGPEYSELGSRYKLVYTT